MTESRRSANADADMPEPEEVLSGAPPAEIGLRPTDADVREVDLDDPTEPVPPVVDDDQDPAPEG
jgi:hypothetical protein